MRQLINGILTSTKYVDTQGRLLSSLLGVSLDVVRKWNSDGELKERLEKAGIEAAAGVVNVAANNRRTARSPTPKKRTKRASIAEPLPSIASDHFPRMPAATITVAVRVSADLRRRMQLYVNGTGDTIQALVTTSVEQFLRDKEF